MSITLASMLRPRLNADLFFHITEIAKPGDIIFTRTPYAAYNLLIPGFWTHCAIYIGYDKFQILDASGRGVSVRSMIDLWTYASECSLGRVIGDRIEIENSIDTALEQVGKKYDWFYSSRRGSYYCSELIHYSYGNLLDTKPRTFRKIVAPQDIYKDPNVEILVSSKE